MLSLRSLLAILGATATLAPNALCQDALKQPACDAPSKMSLLSTESSNGAPMESTKMSTSASNVKAWITEPARWGLDSKDKKKYVSDDPVFFVAPGLGSCDFKYTDNDSGACLQGGWIRNAHQNRCNSWVKVTLPQTGTSVTARVLDSCGNVEGSTFGCNDIYLTASAFMALAGGNQTIKDVGRLPGPVEWSFIEEPCWACYAGLPGLKPDGKPDDCQGVDCSGDLRHGRKKGHQITTGANAGKACATGVDPTTQFDEKVFQKVVDDRVQMMKLKLDGQQTDGVKVQRDA